MRKALARFFTASTLCILLLDQSTCTALRDRNENTIPAKSVREATVRGVRKLYGYMHQHSHHSGSHHCHGREHTHHSRLGSDSNDVIDIDCEKLLKEEEEERQRQIERNGGIENRLNWDSTDIEEEEMIQGTSRLHSSYQNLLADEETKVVQDLETSPDTRWVKRSKGKASARAGGSDASRLRRRE